MQEKLLQFIWQYSLYKPNDLKTADGAIVQVIHPGTLNRDAGPDFSNARIKIGGTTLAGNVELHVKASDWLKHGHTSNAAYHNIILHVVYANDMPLALPGIPVMELKDNIPEYVIGKYSSLINTTTDIPCRAHLQSINSITKESWLNRLLVERWEHKLSAWKDGLQRHSGNWQELFYQQLAQAFGFKVNAVPFRMLAESLPLNVLQKQSSLFSIEALLFGQAGMLEGALSDEYPKRLQEEYRYLRSKYTLTPIAAHLWKYLRMRPANFPSIRIAQLAVVVKDIAELFTALEGNVSLASLVGRLNVAASEYWNTHYRFDDAPARKSTKRLGELSAQIIIINTIAPGIFLYAHTQNKADGQERALAIMEEIPAEENNIIRRWEDGGMKPTNAAQSQALLQLYNNYCTPKQCLECAIGLKIIRSGPEKLN